MKATRRGSRFHLEMSEQEAKELKTVVFRQVCWSDHPVGDEVYFALQEVGIITIPPVRD